MVDLGVPVRALSREPEKLRDQIGEKGRSTIEVASADASDPESQRRAFTGASQLFLAMSNSPRKIELETSIIQIAAESGIKHIVRISSPAFEQSSPVAVSGWHQEIEKTLRESGLIHTVLRPLWVHAKLNAPCTNDHNPNVFFGSWAIQRVTSLTVAIIADVAAEVLTNREVSDQIYTLTGSEIFSYPQIASQLSACLIGR